MRYDEEKKLWSTMSSSARQEYQEPLPPLKLVIMSATLRVEDFCASNLFSPLPPVINVESRQYPVTTHFSRRTELQNYLSEAFRKIVQIHRRLPEGGILCFLTGRNEVLSMCKKLENALNKRDFVADEDDINNEMGQDSFHDLDMEEGIVDEDNIITIEDVADASESDQDDLEDQMLQSAIQGERSSTLKAKILPLYAMMSSELQQQVFQTLPEGYRLIVVATNVAETSITIPNITYVVDTGRQKEKVISMATGISKYEVGFRVWSVCA